MRARICILRFAPAQTLAHHYDLHPLAIEDCISFQRIRSVSYPGQRAAHCTARTAQRKLLAGCLSLLLHALPCCCCIACCCWLQGTCT